MLKYKFRALNDRTHPGHCVEENQGEPPAGLDQQEDHQRDRWELQGLAWQEPDCRSNTRLCSKFYFKQITHETLTDREGGEEVSAQGVRVEGQAVIDQSRAEI